MRDLGWWSISGDALLGALRAVARGGDPDTVYTELYANSDQEPPPTIEERAERAAPALTSLLTSWGPKQREAVALAVLRADSEETT